MTVGRAPLTVVPVPSQDTLAETFVDDLARRAIAHQAVRHPYLDALADGTLPDLHFALRDFGRQYYAYSAHFPRYLTALISKLEWPAHRAALMENLTEESGHYEQEELDELALIGIEPEWIVGLPHPELFRRFRRALGVRDEESSEEELEVVCWREQFLAILTTGSAAEALGALGLGTETIVQTIYQPFVAAIGRIGMHPRDSVFFPLHTAVDDHHQATLREIAIDLARTPQGRKDLAKGMQKALALRCSFWSWLHQRAMDPQVRSQLLAS
ncbi:MAG: TenA family transcriptional regulator [Cyanobacteriota bacterium]